MRWSACLLAVEALAQFGEQQREVLLVFGTEDVAVADLAGVLPVDVEAVELVALDEADGACDEARAGARGERRVGEAAGPGPAADRDEDLERRDCRA